MDTPRRKPRAAMWLRENCQRPTDKCIEWPFAKHARTGHGMFTENYETKYAHREACRIERGPPPSGHEAAHRCGNASCVNVRHIRWATHSENMRDMVCHGTAAKGENSPHSKLSELDVIMIRASPASSSALAKKFGVSKATISDIRARRSWRHLGEPNAKSAQ